MAALAQGFGPGEGAEALFAGDGGIGRRLHDEATDLPGEGDRLRERPAAHVLQAIAREPAARQHPPLTFEHAEEDDLYVWIRRFDSEEQRKALYEAVYESAEWKDEISPLVGDLLDRERIKVTRISPTSKSVIR